ncbi:MAG: hypothetical protein QW320_06790 [Ignisphaera sp.]|uniref:hypothetical protein n=1 Tax=Thermofilum sp. TaxID=1961369 RepID=UPI0031603230
MTLRLAREVITSIALIVFNIASGLAAASMMANSMYASALSFTLLVLALDLIAGGEDRFMTLAVIYITVMTAFTILSSLSGINRLMEAVEQ